MARRHQKWQIGDVFLIEREDGRFVVGQIVGREARVLNSVTVALFDQVIGSKENAGNLQDLDVEKAFSIVFSTRESLDRWLWEIVGHREVAIQKSDMPHEELRSSRFVGAKVYGAGIIRKFVNAYYGLHPWDTYKDPDYFERLLFSPDEKPVDRLIYK